MHIESHSPALASILDADEPVRRLATFDQAGPRPLEGPVWCHEDNCLLFSNVNGNRRYKWTEQDGVSVVAEGTNKGNGMTRDLQGRLLVCELDGRRVTRIEPDGTITVLADKYRGKSLNHPNDLVVKSDGSIYFTDPWTPSPTRPRSDEDLDFCGVYRIALDGALTLLTAEFPFPNGLAFSKDERILYIIENAKHIRSFDVKSDGTLDLASDRMFCDMTKGDRPGGRPDGMKVDMSDNVFCDGAGGLWIMDAQGNHLGTVVHGEDHTTNVAWGGEDWKTLFFTTRYTLNCIRTKIPGVPVPRGSIEPQASA